MWMMKIRPTRAVQLKTIVAASAALLASPAAAVSPAQVAPAMSSSSCSVVWGSLGEYAAGRGTGTIQGVRAGRHACFDRMVIDMSGTPSGYSVGYVDEVYGEGSGEVVPVAGGARLSISVFKGAAFLPNTPSVNKFDTFREVGWGGSFEGYTTFALGVRARLPFRTFVLSNPETNSSRLVIDVAHHW